MKFIFKVLFFFILLYVFTVLLRIFVIEVFWVPSESMEPNVKAKSYIVIEKLSYGALLPQSIDEIPWTNSILLFSQKLEYFLSKKRWEYKRVCAREKIQKGDILVFHTPADTCLLLKRCIGLPGDSLCIEDNIWYCGERDCDYSSKTVCDFEIVEEKNELNKFILKNHILRWSEFKQGDCIFKVKLRGDHVKRLEESKLLKYLDSSNCVDSLMLKAFLLNFKIPKKGDTICLNHRNFGFYSSLINRYEDNIISILDSNFYINGKKDNKFIIENDYYLLLGDNRSNSQDSRKFGLIPMKLIIGRMIYIL